MWIRKTGTSIGISTRTNLSIFAATVCCGKQNHLICEQERLRPAYATLQPMSVVGNNTILYVNKKDWDQPVQFYSQSVVRNNTVLYVIKMDLDQPVQRQCLLLGNITVFKWTRKTWTNMCICIASVCSEELHYLTCEQERLGPACASLQQVNTVENNSILCMNKKD